jgi:hypothetical protein
MSIKGKKWYRSKTILAGILATLTGVVSVLEGGGSWEAAALAGFGGLSVILRALTKEGIVR